MDNFEQRKQELNELRQQIKKDLALLENKLDYKNIKSPQDIWFDCRKSSIIDAGRGIFTKRTFKKGDIVMSSPILRFPMTDINEKAVIRQYNGNIGDGTGFLTFDWQALVNTNSPDKCNVRATWRIKDGYSDFTAIKDIEIGEELFQLYQGVHRIN